MPPPKRQLNVIVTRKLDTAFGDFNEAMRVLGYDLTIIKISLEEEIEDALDVSCFKTLRHTLSEGKVSKVPDFLEGSVKYYKNALKENAVGGVFIPPSMSGVMFDCMIKHIETYFPRVEAADSRPWSRREAIPTLIQEASIILAAIQLGIPVFGSCHGAQLLWYMHGGDLYSLPKYTTIDEDEFNMTSGMLLNPHHRETVHYDTKYEIKRHLEDGYESDPEELSQNDYNHNLLMVTTKKEWPKFHAKPHPSMHKEIGFFFPSHEYFSEEYEDGPPCLPKDHIVARSFTFPGCTATQWHPHKSLQTKSGNHYLHLFGQQCEAYQDDQSRSLEKAKPPTHKYSL